MSKKKNNIIIAATLIVVSFVHFTGALGETVAFIIYICKNYQLPGCQFLPKTLEERQAIISERKNKLNFETKQFNTIINQKFYDRHPELNKRTLNPNNPLDKQLMFEWCDLADDFLNAKDKTKK